MVYSHIYLFISDNIVCNSLILLRILGSQSTGVDVSCTYNTYQWPYTNSWRHHNVFSLIRFLSFCLFLCQLHLFLPSTCYLTNDICCCNMCKSFFYSFAMSCFCCIDHCTRYSRSYTYLYYTCILCICFPTIYLFIQFIDLCRIGKYVFTYKIIKGYVFIKSI